MMFQLQSVFMRKAVRIASNRLAQERGHILVYVIVTMVIFAVLGVSMVSLFSTSVTSSAVRNDNRRAFYLAESGLRYGLSELRQKGFSSSDIATLNDTEYKIPPTGKFDINIFGAWFKSPADQSLNSGTLNVEIDKGKIPLSFFEKALPAVIGDLYLAVASLDPRSETPGPADAEFSEVNGFSYTPGDFVSFIFNLADDFVIGKNKDVCLAVMPLNTDPFSPGSASSYLDLKPSASNIFPKTDGSFILKGLTYYYETAKLEDGKFRLRGIKERPGVDGPDPVVFESSDLILLAPNNYFITSKGTYGEVTFGGDLDYAASLSDHSYHEKPDIELDISKVAQRESNESFISGGTEGENPYLRISGSTGLGAMWYNQNLFLGGLGGLKDVNDYYCAAGRCFFARGLRVFFTLELGSITPPPVGEGLIFAIINGIDNSNASIGGDAERSELLGYAGDGRLDASGSLYPLSTAHGLFPPKVGLEFDSKVNFSDMFENKPVNFCSSPTNLKTNTRNDPNARDAVQYVFWGNNSIDADCRDDLPSYDDNRHSADLFPWLPDEDRDWKVSIGSIESSPAIAPDGSVFVGTINGYLHAFNPDGTRKTGWSAAFDTGTGQPVSTPVIVGDSPNYTIYVTAGNKLFALSPDKNQKSGFPFTVSGTITGKPAIGSGSDKTIYLTSSADVKFGFIYAITPSGNPKPEWSSNPVLFVNTTSPPVITPPVISKNNSRLYFALRDSSGSLYSISTSTGASQQLRSLGARIDKAVAVGTGGVPEGVVYIATNDKRVHALYGDNLLAPAKWTTTSFSPDEAFSSIPAVSPDGNTVYIGSFDDKLYAINAESGELRWAYTATGNVQSTPYVDSSNIVYFGSDTGEATDKRNVYALYGIDKSEKWRFETEADVRGTPAVSPDGRVYIGSLDSYFYSINQFANPKGFRNLRITSKASDSIIGRDVYDLETVAQAVSLDNESHWLRGAPTKRLWAVRMEVTRNPSIKDVPGEYMLSTWMRQCNNNTECDNIYRTFYDDTRVKYPADIRPPLLKQTIKLAEGDHNKFDRFLFGFTSARDATDNQFITIRNFKLSFIRPNDPTATRDPFIPISDPDPNLP